MANEVKVALGVQDNLTTQLRRIEGEVNKFHAGISRKLTQFAAGAVSGAAILGGINTISSSLKTLFNESSEAYKQANEAEKKLKAVLQSTGMQAGITLSQLKKMAGGLQDVTTVEDDTIMSTQHLLLTYKNIGKDVFPQVTEMALNMGEALGGIDAAARLLGKGLNDPVRAITQFRRVGIQFTAAQEEQIKNFAETGRLAEAQKIILAELETQYGGLARAMALDDDGKLLQTYNKIDDIKELIGKEVLPAQLAWNKMILKGLEGVNSILGVVNRAKYALSGKDAGLYDVKNRVDEFTGDIEGLGKKDQQSKIDEYIANLDKKNREYADKIQALRSKKVSASTSALAYAANTGSLAMVPQTQDKANQDEIARLKHEQEMLNAEVEMINDYANKLKDAKERVRNAGGGDGTTPASYKNQFPSSAGPELPAFMTGKDAMSSNIEKYSADMAAKAEQAAREHQEALLRIQTETTDGKINLIENQFERERAIVEARYKELYELANQHKVDTTQLKQQEADIIARINAQEKQEQLSFVSAQLGALANIAQGNRKFIGLYKTMAQAQVGMDTAMSAVRVSKQAYEQFGKINVYAGIAAAVVAAGIVTASGMAQHAKIANMKYASGTQFAPGGYARVGENGPEDMYIPRGAVITNNRETRYNNTTNATTLNVTIIDQSGSVIERTTQQIRDGSADELVRAITEKAGRL